MAIWLQQLVPSTLQCWESSTCKSHSQWWHSLQVRWWQHFRLSRFQPSMEIESGWNSGAVQDWGDKTYEEGRNFCLKDRLPAKTMWHHSYTTCTTFPGNLVSPTNRSDVAISSTRGLLYQVHSSFPADSSSYMDGCHHWVPCLGFCGMPWCHGWVPCGSGWWNIGVLWLNNRAMSRCRMAGCHDWLVPCLLVCMLAKGVQ